MATVKPENRKPYSDEPAIMTYNDIRLLINNFKYGDDPTELLDIKYNLTAFNKEEYLINKKIRHLIDKKLNEC